MRIGIISDLHLDHGPLPKKWDWGKGDFLIVAGDLGFRRELLVDVIEGWSHGMIVPGNHDLWERDGPPVGGVSCDRVDGVSVLACTLWADLSDPMAALALRSYPEFAGGGLSAAAVTLAHRVQLADLRRHIAALDPGEPAIVATHFPPTHQMRGGRREASPADAYFSTDLEELVEALPAGSIWACGHTHVRRTVTIGGTRVIQHALGYPGERGDCRGPLIVEM